GGKDSHDLTPELKLTVAWEINLWGAQTWEQRRARAGYLAEIERERAMRMSLVAEVASTYFRLIALRNELAIVQRTLQTRIEGVEKARLRFEGGMTSEIVYQQAVVEYATTASLEPDLKSRLTQTRNALSLLMGAMPDDLLADSVQGIEVSLPADVPAGLPSTLLQRRPDIRMAEQQLAAAMAGVGVAYADRFPRIRIALTGGFENDAFADLLRSPFSYTLGNIAGPILDFGRRKRRYQASIAVYDQARYAYEQSVLTAFSEVDNAISVYNNTRHTARLKQELCNAAMKYVTLAHAQYLGGSLAYIDVLDAQRRYFDAQIALSNAVRDECLALVSLYKSLGGGWRR
ncbi:MAG: TolC family protein, partial [Bacteroidales bacterium]|nr:TolC family protein [Bacteroidales bacterium]